LNVMRPNNFTALTTTTAVARDVIHPLVKIICYACNRSPYILCLIVMEVVIISFKFFIFKPFGIPSSHHFD
jgi:hypothetical protein